MASSFVTGPMQGQQSAVSKEFHVDGNCRIYDAADPKTAQHTFRDRGICAVDPEHVSSRPETDFVNSVRKRINVTIREHTFTFHNPTQEPAMFVLNQAVPKGWQVDSEPAPNQVTGPIATFLVSVEPGQTVSLHVGERNPPRN